MTKGKRIPCEINGVRYPSLAEAAIASGVEPNLWRYRLKHPGAKKYRTGPVQVDGVWYDRLTDAAKTLGITKEGVRQRIKREQQKQERERERQAMMDDRRLDDYRGETKENGDG